jgi:hypothetical protein
MKVRGNLSIERLLEACNRIFPVLLDTVYSSSRAFIQDNDMHKYIIDTLAVYHAYTAGSWCIPIPYPR